QVGGRHRNVFAEPERVVLVDPGVVARLGAVLPEALEARTGIWVQRPALRAMIAGRRRSVERAFAFAPVEAGQMAAAQRCPYDAVLVDVAATEAETLLRHVVDFRQRGLGRIGAGDEAYESRRAAKDAGGVPDGAVHRTR